MDIAKDIVSDIIKGVEELLWPQQQFTEDLVPTKTEKSAERVPDTEIKIVSSEKPDVVPRKIETGGVADICLQKYWFRISRGRANLLVFCVSLTDVADIKERENQN